MRDSVSVFAPAKINLALHVLGRRENGYHDLESLVVFAGVGDELSVKTDKSDSLVITGPFDTALDPGPSNLITRAVKLFRAEWPEAVTHGVHITLEKNLPVAAGIGGGSADAAAALRAMAAFSKVEIPTPELANLALELGADVPLCLYSRTCTARGVGEIVQPVRRFPALHVVLINPLVSISTRAVFERWQDTRRDTRNAQLAPLPDWPITKADMGRWMAETRNDLEVAATEMLPHISKITGALYQTNNCIGARMSGSGATVFGLFASAAAASKAAVDMRQLFREHWIAEAPIIQS